MPGNEVGDRVHNFFGQDNLPQGQQLEVVDRNWQGSANNLWVGSQRQNAFPLISNIKNYGVHQSDTESANGTSAFHATHGINFTQPNLRQDFNVSQFQNQQANGYLQGHHIFPARQNEENIFAMGTGYDRHNLTSNNLPILAPQQGMGVELQKRSYTRFPNIESPVNFHHHGNDEQMAGQHPAIFQSLQRQQSGISDMQIVQQQLMLKQLQEAQKQQFSQQQIWQQDSTNQLSSMAKQAAINYSQSLLNGIPVHDTSNYSQNGLMPSSTNWLQANASIPMPGSSIGPILSPEQGQTLRLMGSDARRVDQSIYGLPPVSRDSPSQTPNIHINNLDASTRGQSFLGNQRAAFSGQASVQNGPFLSRQVDTGNCLSAGFESVSSRQEPNRRQEFAGLSETSQGKNLSPPAPSQNVATLDPTEQRILFGGDDNLWDAFGEGSNVGTGGFNSSNEAGVASGISSLQSGSWSALMQSALAETSSADTGPQEEWSGLSFRNTEIAMGSQRPSTINDNTGNQPRWNNSKLPSRALNSRPSHLAGDMVASPGDSNLSAFQQLDTRVSQEQSMNFQADISQSFIQDRNKLLTSPLQKPSLEGNQIYTNVVNSSDVEAKNKFMSSAWAHPQNLTSLNATDQLIDRPNGFKAVESVFPSDGASVRSPHSENSLHSLQSHSQNRGMHGEVGHGTEIHKSAAFARVSTGLEHAFGSSLSDRRDSTPDNASAMSHFSSSKGSQEGSQQVPNVHGFDFWRRLGSSVCSERSEIPGGSCQPLDQTSQNLGSPGKNETPERDNPHKKENSSASFHSNTFHNIGADVPKENVWVDAGEMRHAKGSKQKLFSAVAQKPSVMRRFQYHPMGNIDIDEESSDGVKNGALSQAMNQQARGLRIQDQGFRGNSGQAEMNSMEMHKVGRKISEEPSKSLNAYASTKFLSLDKSGGSFLPNQNSQPSSQNMLELLHKVDQSGDPGTTSHFSSTDRSDVNEAETSDSSVGQIQRNQSSASQIFGLQLAPPSQRVPNFDRALAFSSGHSSDGGEKGLISSLPSVKGTSQLDNLGHAFKSGLTSNKSSFDIQGNSSAFPLPKSRLQHVSVREAEGQPLGGSFNELASHSNQTENSNEGSQPGQRAVPPGSDASAGISHHNTGSATERTHPGGAYQMDPRYSTQQFQAVGVPQSSISSGLLLNKLPNLQSRDGSQQQSLSTLPGISKGEQSKLHSQSYSSDGTILSQAPKVQVDESQKGGVSHSEISASTAKLQSGIGEGQAMKEISQSEGPFENADSVQSNQQGNNSVQRKEIEAFGRYLKSTNVLHSNYSLLHQVQAMKNTENEPNDSRLKKVNSPDSGPDPLQVTSRKEKSVLASDVTRERQVPIENSSVALGDPKLSSFSGRPRDNRHASMGPPNTVPPNSSFSKNPSHITDHPRISPQMAPSWFDQYGTFKNGHVLQIFDPRRMASIKQTEQPLVVGKPAEDLQVGNSMDEATAAFAAQPFNGVGHNVSPIMKPIEAISAQDMPLSDASDQSLSVKQKKRKSPTSELHAWHKEVSEDARRLHDISVAEAEWAITTNRVIEKVESGLEMIEDGQPSLRPKRRLILTKQLMQQLFRPPPAAFLSADAASHHENAVYFTARMSLGDACTAISHSNNDAPVPNSGKNSYEKPEVPQRSNHHDLLKAMEGLVGRAEKLENELSRLDQSYSVLDLRVECQELEKFSLINRIAKLYARGQSDGTENMSSDAYSQKSCPQKYVSAVPMPRNLPDNVQCLSL